VSRLPSPADRLGYGERVVKLLPLGKTEDYQIGNALRDLAPLKESEQSSLLAQFDRDPVLLDMIAHPATSSRVPGPHFIDTLPEARTQPEDVRAAYPPQVAHACQALDVVGPWVSAREKASIYDFTFVPICLERSASAGCKRAQFIQVQPGGFTETDEYTFTGQPFDGSRYPEVMAAILKQLPREFDGGFPIFPITAFANMDSHQGPGTNLIAGTLDVVTFVPQALVWAVGSGWIYGRTRHAESEVSRAGVGQIIFTNADTSLKYSSAIEQATER
jgi:hypothetical protein